MKPTIYTADGLELTAFTPDAQGHRRLHKVTPEAAADELNLLTRELAAAHRQAKIAAWCSTIGWSIVGASIYSWVSHG